MRLPILIPVIVPVPGTDQRNITTYPREVKSFNSEKAQYGGNMYDQYICTYGFILDSQQLPGTSRMKLIIQHTFVASAPLPRTASSIQP